VGLPAGADAGITVSGPGGFTRRLAGSGTLTGLTPGTYTVSAPEAEADGDGYLGAPAAQSVAVKAGSAAGASISYSRSTGRLEVAVAGVPDGSALVQVTGPNGFSANLTGSQTLKKLSAGSYTVTAAQATVSGDRYSASVPSQTVAVAASAAPATAAVDYLLVSGRLQVTVSGVPAGAVAAVTVTGPSGFAKTLSASQLLLGLDPGSYSISAPILQAGGHSYQPTLAPGPTVAVAASATPATATVSYAITTGGLTVMVTGLPAGTSAAVIVTGPGGYSRSVAATETMVGLAPGSYTVAAAAVTVAGQTYSPSPATQTQTVSVGATAAAAVAYAGPSGNLAVAVTGLPGGVAANIGVSGPGGFAQTITATTTLTSLVAGTYTITANNVAAGGQTYLPSPLSQTVTVSAGATANRAVTYTAAGASGALTLTVSGLPGGTSAAIVVTGPGGYNQTVTGTVTLSALVAGSYTIAASNVSAGGSTYGPSPASQSITVTGGATASATVSYAILTGATLNLQIDGMYLTQAVASYDGTTPVIANRDGYLRVFVKANQSNTAAPSVRVRLYTGASLIQTSTIPAPAPAVPTAVNEGVFASSWNLLIPAGQVQPNLRILADVDPTNQVAESDDSDNAFPVGGTPFAVDVRPVPTWNVRFVPVFQQTNGLQGNVSAANQAQFLADPLKVLPVAGVSVDIRAVYTTTAAAVESNNANGAWGTILSELWALKTAEASPRYYYGVVKTSYGSGVAGIGYVGGGINAALGWDALPSGSGIMAHEVGHNLGRGHAPCGGVAGPDPSFPYPGGRIGVYGLDVATQAVKSPTTHYDLMGYCSPDWVSDYTWAGMIAYRQSNPSYAPTVAPAGTTSGLLVWGRIAGSTLVLEPAFRVSAPPTPTRPASSARVRVEGVAADGAVLFSAPIEPVPSSTLGAQGAPEEHFAAVLAVSPTVEAAVVRLRLVAPSGVVERLVAGPVGPNPPSARSLPDPAVAIRRPNARQAAIRWDQGSYPMALVRDAATGAILSFARGGSATVWPAGRAIEVTFSNGVQSLRRQFR
jgi:hypothetical protein